jgi:hypothetical protein
MNTEKSSGSLNELNSLNKLIYKNNLVKEKQLKFKRMAKYNHVYQSNQSNQINEHSRLNQYNQSNLSDQYNLSNQYGQYNQSNLSDQYGQSDQSNQINEHLQLNQYNQSNLYDQYNLSNQHGQYNQSNQYHQQKMINTNAIFYSMIWDFGNGDQKIPERAIPYFNPPCPSIFPYTVDNINKIQPYSKIFDSFNTGLVNAFNSKNLLNAFGQPILYNDNNNIINTVPDQDTINDNNNITFAIAITKMEVIIWIGFWTIDDCNKYFRNIFIFEDNDFKLGTDGRAVIRDCKNAFGIPTKKLPGTGDQTYYSDKEIKYNKINISNAVHKIKHALKTGMYNGIILPQNPIGTDSAQLNTRAPKTYAYLMCEINELIDWVHKQVQKQHHKPQTMTIAK